MLFPVSSSVFLNNEDTAWSPPSSGLKFQSAERLKGSLGWCLSLKGGGGGCVTQDLSK